MWFISSLFVSNYCGMLVVSDCRHDSSTLCLQLVCFLHQWTERARERCHSPQVVVALRLLHFPKLPKSAKASCLGCCTMPGFIIPMVPGIPMFIPIPIMPWWGAMPIPIPIPMLIPMPAPGCIMGFTGGLTAVVPRLMVVNPWESMLPGAWLPGNQRERHKWLSENAKHKPPIYFRAFA